MRARTLDWDVSIKKTFENVYRETSQAQKNTAEGGSTKYSIFLDRSDIPDYLKSGDRLNKNRQKRYDNGQQMIISSEAEFDEFIKKSINGKSGEMSAYGKVAESLAVQVLEKSSQKIDISGYYLELLSDDINHAYSEHRKAKEQGDLDMEITDLAYALKSVNTGEVLNVKQYKDGGKRVKISIPMDNGVVVLVELVSKSTGSLRLKTGWKMSSAKYEKKYGNNANSTGSRNSTNAVRDAIASNSSISHSDPNVNTQKSFSAEYKAQAGNRLWRCLSIFRNKR